MSNRIPVTENPTSTRFMIQIEHLWNGQTKLTAPMNNPKLCEAMLADALSIIRAYKPESEAQERATHIQLPPKAGKIILPNGF